MTNKFWQETKEILSEFIYETKEYAAWVAKEVKRQYHLSILKEIALTYPETTLNVNKAYEIVDGVPLDCPDFIESPERTNSIIVWDSGFSDTQWSVGVVIVKEGNSYRVVNGISGKLNITDQLEAIAKLSLQYSDAVVGILPKANGAALFSLLQSKLPNTQKLETYFGSGTRLQKLKDKGKLLFSVADFEYYEEWELAIACGIDYFYNQSFSSFTDVDLADLKEGDRLTSRWGNAPEDGFGLPDTYERTNIQSNFAIDDPAFETEAETDAFKFVEMKQNISDDGLNEPRYPYDNEPSA